MDSKASQSNAQSRRDRMSEQDAPDDRSISSALSRHAPPQPAELRDARTGLINLKELRAQQEDPAIGLLDTLQAVREKQNPPGKTQTADAPAGLITSSDASPFARPFSTRTAIFIALAVAMILMVWGVLKVLDRASSPIVPPSNGGRNAEHGTDAGSTNERESAGPQAPVNSTSPHLSRPVFPRSAPGAVSSNPAPRTGISRSSENEESAVNSPSAVDLDAEKEKLRQREEEDRQRESGMSDADAAQTSNAAPADDGATHEENENRSPQSVPPEDSPPTPADGEITTY